MKQVQRAVDLAGARWRKSTRSGDNGGSCVEVAAVDNAITVRDSKDPTGSALVFTGAGWTAFLDGVRGGEFDLS